VTALFASGQLSYSKVRALTRVATPESEHELVELARTATASQLERLIRASVVAMTDPARREGLRRLTTGTDDDGMGVLHARMRVDELAVVEAALDSSAEESKVDALVKICESYLARGDAARPAPARHHAVVHVQLDRSGVTTAETEAGAPVPPATAERVLCDATVQGMLGDLHHPIGVGRTTRTIPERLRRALRHRSGGACEWIGCTERRYVEAHHVRHWTHGGPTELSNLVQLCWHHHHLVHEGGWHLHHDHHDHHGRLRCTRPDGTELHDPTPIDVSSLPLAPVIDDDRIVPRWRGERLDRAACVELVLTALAVSL
jgi:hypothetical protein